MNTPLASSSVSFADIAHQTLIFDRSEPASALVLKLIDTRWVQRLRSIRQTGNTNLVYMFSEHSRFGHSLGVAYLGLTLMEHLQKFSPAQVLPFKKAVAAACLLHDIGHVAPGSHLAEHIWSKTNSPAHEGVTARVLRDDPEISALLQAEEPGLQDLVRLILEESEKVPNWTWSLLSGGGWNVDRGNWAIVDSAMCSVTYGRYNVAALIDAFRLSENGELVLLESRLDALTHFFVARDSMYRQVYQHRVLQAADALTRNMILRIRDIISAAGGDARSALAAHDVFADEIMLAALATPDYVHELALEAIYQMTDHWWFYHLNRWCGAGDPILADLAQRLRDRRMLKTIRAAGEDESLIGQAEQVCLELGFDPRYYLVRVRGLDQHRSRIEEAPRVMLDSGELVSVAEIEPLIAKLSERSSVGRNWIAVPKEVKEKLGRVR